MASALKPPARFLTIHLPWISRGLGNGLVLTVIYTERSEVIRIISARKATRAERKEYDDNGW